MTSKMRAYLDVQKKKSEVTSRLLEIRLTPEHQLTPELREEVTILTEQQAKLEGEFRSSMLAVQSEQESAVTVLDTEDRELRQLAKTANIGEVISAVSEQRMATGATAEIQAHYKLNSNQIPVEMLRLERGVEERAAATVPSSIADANQAEVVTPIFASGDGAFLGIERPLVGVGVASHPILGTNPSVKGPYTDSTEAGQTDGVFAAHSLAPERLQANYAYRASDAARFAGLDSSLRLALNGGLTESLDQQAINGSDGLLNGSNLSNNNVTALSSWLQYLDRLLYGRVDGRFARAPGDVRILLGTAVYSHLSSLYRANETDETASERLGRKVGRADGQSARSGALKQEAERLDEARLGIRRGGPANVAGRYDPVGPLLA